MKAEEKYYIITEIKKLTDVNDHSGAIVLASILLDFAQKSGETIRTKVLKHVREIHYLQGEISPELLAIREKSRPWIVNGLKEVLTNDEFKQFEESM